MGVDTKGCVVTEVKDAFEVAKIVQGWSTKVLKRHEIDFSLLFEENNEFTSIRTEFYSFGSMVFCFRYKGEDRQLHVSFFCDGDLRNHKDEIKGDKCLWFSFGKWGSSVELMKSLMIEFKSIGEVYVDEDDCDDVGFYKI